MHDHHLDCSHRERIFLVHQKPIFTKHSKWLNAIFRNYCHDQNLQRTDDVEHWRCKMHKEKNIKQHKWLGKKMLGCLGTSVADSREIAMFKTIWKSEKEKCHTNIEHLTSALLIAFGKGENHFTGMRMVRGIDIQISITRICRAEQQHDGLQLSFSMRIICAWLLTRLVLPWKVHLLSGHFKIN